MQNSSPEYSPKFCGYMSTPSISLSFYRIIIILKYRIHQFDAKSSNLNTKSIMFDTKSIISKYLGV